MTKTGQATGLLLYNWVLCIGGKFIQNTACEGLKRSARRLMDSNHGILRIVINIGPEIRNFPAVIHDYNDNKRDVAYLTKWLAFDFLMLSNNNDLPVTLTIIQAVMDNGHVVQKAFINKKCVKTGNPLDSKDRFWEDMKNAASRMGFEEFWSTLTGGIIPYRGFLQGRTRGVLYTSEESRHVCILADDFGNISDSQDQIDIERLESMLEECGVPVEDYIKENMSEKTVMQILKQISSFTNSSDKQSKQEQEILFEKNNL